MIRLTWKTLIFLLISSWHPLSLADSTAQTWFEQMQTALKKTSYDMVFLKTQATHTLPFRYRHGVYRNHELAVSENLNGPAAQIFKIDQLVVYSNIKQERLSIHSHYIPEIFPHGFFHSWQRLNQAYTFSIGGKLRLAGRNAQAFSITPKDNKRYRYQLYLDQKTKLPLQFDIVFNKQILERFQVLQLSKVKVSEQLKSLLSHTWPKATQAMPSKQTNQWKFKQLPTGFKQVSTDSHLLAGKFQKVHYFLLDDGMTKISVYVAPKEKPNLPANISLKNSINMINITLHNKEIVVIGKAPDEFLKKIGMMVQPLPPTNDHVN